MKSSVAGMLTLDPTLPIWSSFFSVAPLVLIGTIEEGGGVDLAPKHMATPLGWGNHFGFVCTPRHATYRNVLRTGVFTVNYPRPDQVVAASLTAETRSATGAKQNLAAIPTLPATIVEGVLVEGANLALECELDRIVDGFGDNSLVAGRILAAHVREDALRDADQDDGDLIHASPLIVYLNPGRWAEIERSYSFPFPARFEL